MRRVMYLDSGLSSNVGHHAQSARVILAELNKNRGIGTQCHAHQSISDGLVVELNAHSSFSLHTYTMTTGDQISGWLHAFVYGASVLANELRALNIGKDDLVYWNSAQPIQLQGLIHWLRECGDDAPRTVVELGTDSGATITWDSNEKMTLGIPDPRQDSRALLYRFIGQCCHQEGWPQTLTMCSFSEVGAMAYASLMAHEVEAWPVPRGVNEKAFKRCKPITVGFIGHQRGERGLLLIADIIKEVFKCMPGIKVIYHNGDWENGGEAQKQIEKITHGIGQFILLPHAADSEQWQTLLDACSLVVLPYMPGPFAARYSSVAAECCCNAIPYVCPSRTSMARMAASFGAGVEFDELNVESVVMAIKYAVQRFDVLADTAYAGVEKWKAKHGPDKFVDRLLAKEVSHEPELSELQVSG